MYACIHAQINGQAENIMPPAPFLKISTIIKANEKSGSCYIQSAIKMQ